MARYVSFLLLMLILFPLNDSFAQSVYYSGNLLRIPFSGTQINPADTTGFWYRRSFDSAFVHSFSYKKYFAHIRTSQKSYFLNKYEGYSASPSMEWRNGKQLIENEGTLYNREFSFLPGLGWDIIEPYMITKTIISETNNGLWLNNGAFGNSFLANNDSLFYFKYPDYGTNPSMPELLRAILGKIGDRYLAAFMDKNFRRSYSYYIINPNDSPQIDSLRSVKISIIGDSSFIFDPGNTFALNTPSQVRKLSGDLYAITTDHGAGFCVYRFADTSFHYIKNVLKDELISGTHFGPSWEIRNNKLYLLNNRQIVSFDFNAADTTFINKRTLLSDLSYPASYYMNDTSYNFGIDRNMKYAAKVFSGPEDMFRDTLKIFDIDKGEFINSIVLNNIKGPFLPVVDSPYVYIHQVIYKYTDVSRTDHTKLNNFRLSAYPNPFNPIATICYSIPHAAKVELKIYDILGREISMLVNKEQSTGEYKINFDASSLPSGIYIYAIHAGDYRASKKLMLLK
ncbi:MAG: T9SS type A sorting domain-containing protein [Bacteroidota bacterium]|nr:T9SS type A sorting domain-containing protein [Bacteroidota bacterium]